MPVKLSTKIRYGLRAMLDLTFQYGAGATAMREIARRQHISEPYLEQIVTAFRKAGLINSIRGVQGGYQLAKNPTEISLAVIIEALEGPLLPAATAGPEDPEDAAINEVWQKVNAVAYHSLLQMTLADLQRVVVQQREQTAPMFYI